MAIRHSISSSTNFYLFTIFLFFFLLPLYFLNVAFCISLATKFIEPILPNHRPLIGNIIARHTHVCIVKYPRIDTFTLSRRETAHAQYTFQPFVVDVPVLFSLVYLKSSWILQHTSRIDAPLAFFLTALGNRVADNRVFCCSSRASSMFEFHVFFPQFMMACFINFLNYLSDLKYFHFSNCLM